MPLPSTPCRIGITCDYETFIDRRGAPAARYVSPAPYVEAVMQAGADPWLLPNLAPERAGAYLERLDGLVLSGGDFDVPPAYYGQAPRAGLGTVLEARSASERGLLIEALRRDLPILGVCGGMQLLNVVAGGTLFQDVRERPGTAQHQQPHDKREPHHEVRLEPDSRLAAALGETTTRVNSTHHQLIDGPGPSVRVVGVAPDGVVEAIEWRQATFVVGVQWHPEVMHDPAQRRIYQALVDAARAIPGAPRSSRSG
ncbi:MAG TPA: gamma-glutamyl-gamma-aminobutyrate hydrolase family protein [Myxococcota bacterium]|nr:gamma-glutamyl-gamma-aminobutyrate hydrolase family protein [Myxococcota bacterium]